MRYLPRVAGWITLALLALPALLASMYGLPAYAQALPGQVEITDTIQVSSQGQSYVQLQLINCPTQHPRVILNAVLSRTVVQTDLPPFYADASGNVVGYAYPNDILSCDGTVGHSAYRVTYVQNGVPTGSTDDFIVTSSINPFNLSQNTPVTQLPPPFVAGQDFHFRNLTLDDTLIANEVIANKFVFGNGAPGTISLAWTTGGVGGTNVNPTIVILSAAPTSSTCNANTEYGNIAEQLGPTSATVWYCTAGGWSTNATSSAGVASIDGQTGAFTFTGSGVTHTGNAYTFTNSGGGGGGGINSGVTNAFAYYVDPTHIAGDIFLNDRAPTDAVSAQLSYTGGGGAIFSTGAHGGSYLFDATSNFENGAGQISLITNTTSFNNTPTPGQIEISASDSGGVGSFIPHSAADIVIAASETSTGASDSSGNVSISANDTSFGNGGNVSITANAFAPSPGSFGTGDITETASRNINLNPGFGGYVDITGGFRSESPQLTIDQSGNITAAGRIASKTLHPGVCLESDASGVIVPSALGLPCNSLGGGSGGGGGTTTTNQVLGSKVTSASAPGKICAAVAGINGSVFCGGVQGTPLSITVQSGLNAPILNTLGVANSVAQYGLNVNSSTNTQILLPTTIGSFDQASVFRREMWFEGGSNLNGIDNFEVDNYNFIKSSAITAMFGFQCNRHNTGFWQYDNFDNGWTNTSVACSIVTGHVYHFILWTHIDALTSTACSGKPCEHWDTFQLDDLTASTTNTYNLNVTLPMEPETSGNGRVGWDGAGSQVQVDVVDTATGGTSTLVSMYVDDDNFTAYIPVTSTGGGTTTVTETTGNLGEYDFDGSSPTTGLTATGTPSLDSTNSYSSPNAMLFNGATEYETAPISPAASTVFARAEVNVGTAPTASSTQFLGLYNGSAQLINMFFNSVDGVIKVNNTAGTNTVTTCSASALTPGTWHRVELAWTQSSSAGSFQVLIDGTSTCSVSGVTTGTQPATSVRFGELSAASPAWVFDMDNVGFSSTGLLGAVTINTNSVSPLYDLFGSAATVKAGSLQKSSNLSDVNNAAASLSNLLGNPVAGTYIVTCSSNTSCAASPLYLYQNNGLALPTSSIAANGCTAAAGSPFSASAVTSTSKPEYAFASDPTGIAGYSSGLSVKIVAGSGTVTVKVCNPTGSPVTPGAMSINDWVLP